MTMIDYAESELRKAGFFDKDSDYGMIGPAVLKMIKQFAKERHSGWSAVVCLYLFERLAQFKPIHSIRNPMLNGEYVDQTKANGGKLMYQGTRLSTLFSEDGGKTWYDIELKLPRWKRLLGIRRAYVTFPYSPK